jgi:predicted ATPase
MAGGLFFQLNTQFGMLNIHPEDNRFPDNKIQIRNTGFGLSLGYSF